MRHPLSTCSSYALLTACLLFAAACSDEPGSGNDQVPPADMSSSPDPSDMGSTTPEDMGSTTSPDMEQQPPVISSGMTDCGALPTGESISCQPSQHCADSTLNRCDLGCLSDLNCPGNETCAKESGRSVGSCVRKSGAEGILPDDASRTGISACGMNVDGSTVTCQPSQYCADSTLAQCQTGCLSDFNCPNGEQCNKAASRDVGVCEKSTPIDPCAGISCNAGETCVNGTCASNDPCAGISCNAGETCVNGTCTSNDPCAGISCDAGETCNNGACVSNDPCAGVSCNAGEVCNNGSCVPTTTSCIPNATAQDGCPVDHICVFDANDDPVCFKFPACDAQNSCDPGIEGAVCSTEFINGKSPQCLPNTCIDDTNCPNTWKCVIFQGDPAGFCDTGEFGSFCTNNQDCNAGLICDGFSETCG